MRFESAAGIVTFAVVVAAVAVGFATIGSPQHLRLVELDSRRVDDLRELAYDLQVGQRSRGRERLPESLIGTADPNGRRRDPLTGVPYEYHREDARRYRLCATFALASQPDRTPAHWAHGSGRECFPFDAYLGAEPLAGSVPRQPSGKR